MFDLGKSSYGIETIAAGSYYSLALKSDGTVWTWGSNLFGELGNESLNNSNTPVQVSGLSGIIAISTGLDHSLALKSDGTVWAWGDNSYGEFGNDTSINSDTPVQVSGLAGVVAISAGSDYSLALKSDGTVWAWGDNLFGELGNNSTTNSDTPLQVSGLSGITAISAGLAHSLALKKDGTVWGWGSGLTGAVSGLFSEILKTFSQGFSSGAPNNMGNPVLTPVQVSNLTSVTAIAAGSDFNLAIVGSAAQIPTLTPTPTSNSTTIQTAVTSFTPTSGSSDTSVVIAGSGFTGATAVSFGSTVAQSFTVNSDTQITAVVGNGSSGRVSVTTPGGTVTKGGFSFITTQQMTNWAGYLVETNQENPQSNVVTDIKGSWVVPKVTTSDVFANSSVWIGIDGYGSNNKYIVQIGTVQKRRELWNFLLCLVGDEYP